MPKKLHEASLQPYAILEMSPVRDTSAFPFT